MKLLTIFSLLLCGCAGSKSPKTAVAAVPAKCITIQCLDADGCYYDRAKQQVVHERVTLACIPAK